MFSKNQKRNNLRKQNGQALLEGAASFTMITACVIGGILLILGVYFSVFYKSKLSYAVVEGAKIGSQKGYFLGAKRQDYSSVQQQTDVVNAVNNALIAQGLRQAKPGNIIVTSTTISDVQGVKVSLKHDDLGIVSGGLLPSNITLSETAFFPYENDKPTAILGLSIGGTGAVKDGQGLFVPMYGGGSIAPGNEAVVAAGGGQGPVPTGNFPYWKVAFLGEKVPAYSLGVTNYNDPSKLVALSRVERFGVEQEFNGKKK